MISWDIRHGLGVSVFDPHGGLVEAALEMIPTRRTNELIYSKPDDPDHVPGTNPLDVRGQRHRRNSWGRPWAGR